MIRNLLKPLSFLPALLLMYMIFSFSAQTGDVSSQLSHRVSVKIVEAGNYIFDANLENWQIEHWAGKIGFITRKLAHMTEYFLLAIAVSFPLYVYGMHGILLMLTAGMICVAFACGDEYHQSFVAGRGPSAKDVCIDSIGIFFGIILVRIIGWTGRKTVFRPKEKRIKNKRRREMQWEEDWYEEDDYAPDPGYRRNSGSDWGFDTGRRTAAHDDWGFDTDRRTADCDDWGFDTDRRNPSSDDWGFSSPDDRRYQDDDRYEPDRSRYPADGRYESDNRRYPADDQYDRDGRSYSDDDRYEPDGRRYPADDRRYEADIEADQKKRKPRKKKREKDWFFDM